MQFSTNIKKEQSIYTHGHVAVPTITISSNEDFDEGNANLKQLIASKLNVTAEPFGNLLPMVKYLAAHVK